MMSAGPCNTQGYADSMKILALKLKKGLIQIKELNIFGKKSTNQ